MYCLAAKKPLENGGHSGLGGIFEKRHTECTEKSGCSLAWTVAHQGAEEDHEDHWHIKGYDDSFVVPNSSGIE